MYRYKTAALALKMASANTLTRGAYRRLGNYLGDRRRGKWTMPSYYFDRIRRMLRLIREHGVAKDGDRILELGTGWLHWEALTVRLFLDVECELYDVWDNRQIDGLRNGFRQLNELLHEDDWDLDPAGIEKAQATIRTILEAPDFETIYSDLGLNYVVEESGSLEMFPEESFDMVVSAGVLEHVDRAAVPKLFSELARVLKPGGHAVHSIDTGDHLFYYDRSANPKQYISFSESQWKRLYENKVQYLNRFQRSEWLDLLESSGLELVEEDSRMVDIGDLKPAPRYAEMESTDLACTVLRVVLRKAKEA